MMAEDKNFINHYNQYKDKIFSYIWYRVDFDRALAEDLVSEVFVKAYSHYGTFDQSRSFQAWIYAIARNHLLNHYRKGKRELSLEEVKEQFVLEADHIDNKLEAERIIQKISEMDDYCREVLLMRYVDRLEYSDMSLILKKKEGAIRTQVSRSLASLKEKLEKED